MCAHDSLQTEFVQNIKRESDGGKRRGNGANQQKHRVKQEKVAVM